MRAKRIRCVFPVAVILLTCASQGVAQRKDYLGQVEADKIRDAEGGSARIKLFLGFAADRIKKFQYELSRPATPGDRRHGERLNALLNAYSGCLDDAAELVDLGREKQEDIHAGIKEIQAKGKEYLAILEDLAANGAEKELYKETLEDAIEATRDAIKDAEKASKEVAPPPVRRKN